MATGQTDTMIMATGQTDRNGLFFACTFRCPAAQHCLYLMPLARLWAGRESRWSAAMQRAVPSLRSGTGKADRWAAAFLDVWWRSQDRDPGSCAPIFFGSSVDDSVFRAAGPGYADTTPGDGKRSLVPDRSDGAARSRRGRRTPGRVLPIRLTATGQNPWFVAAATGQHERDGAGFERRGTPAPGKALPK